MSRAVLSGGFCPRTIFSVRSGMLETNKQILIFKFGEDLSYFVILRYKLRDFIKIYDDYVNVPI